MSRSPGTPTSSNTSEGSQLDQPDGARAQAAVGKEELRQLAPPLRVRRAHDLGWVPGCWLKADHDRFAAEAAEPDKPKRKLFTALAGR